jgi:hypothetical protein
MSRKMLLGAVACASVLMLAFGSQVASASRSLSISPAGAVRYTSIGKYTLEEEEGFSVACNVTLEVTLPRMLGKTRGASGGAVNEARMNECTESVFGLRTVVTPLMMARWQRIYDSFLGSLPNITGILFRSEMRALVRTAMWECLFETTPNAPETPNFPEDGVLQEAGGWRDLVSIIRLKTRLSGACPPGIRGVGSFRASTAQRLTLL